MKRNSTTFKPGEITNPRGRPKIPAEIKAAFREFTIDARDKLVEIMEMPLDDKSAGSICRAAEAILNRGWGTPAQSIELNHNIPQSGKFILEIVDGTKREKPNS